MPFPVRRFAEVLALLGPSPNDADPLDLGLPIRLWLVAEPGRVRHSLRADLVRQIVFCMQLLIRKRQKGVSTRTRNSFRPLASHVPFSISQGRCTRISLCFLIWKAMLMFGGSLLHKRAIRAGHNVLANSRGLQF